MGATLLLPSLYALFLISLLGPLVIFLLFRMIRTSYVKQVAISVAKKVKYKSLTRYVLLWCASQRLLTCLLSAHCNDSFVTEGQWLTFKSIIALLILCGVVLAINLFSALLQAVRFSGMTFCRKSICFSPVKMRCRPFLPSRFGFGYSYCWLLK